MTSSRRATVLLAATCLLEAVSAFPADRPPAGTTASAVPGRAEPLPTVDVFTAGFERRAGLLDLLLDRARGRLYLVLPAPDADGTVGSFLYIEGLVVGLGSNPVGLDRGQIGPTLVVRFRRVGGRVLVEALNLAYRADQGAPEERGAVAESFATSVLWGGPLTALDPDGRAVVDFTSFAVRDAHGVVNRLKAADQGTFELDVERSAVSLDGCLAFPANVELEAVLTFAGASPGPEVRAIAPDPHSVTLTQHHSFVALPDDGYRPRRHDPRAGSFAIAFTDYGARLGAPVQRRWIVRHRLEKSDPGAALSPAVEPIVYYVDRAAPEPIRSALVDGARWWEAAFSAAGFEDAYRVELLPEGVHPLDVRYNVIQWVHRATRGWSYGGGVVDPRTGEMLKGHVSLGSLRVRQDMTIFEGLAGADRVGSGAVDDPAVLALSRLRQLAAHEVGHTLGLAHNFAASTYDGRASVMDYPAPLVRVGRSGDLDFSSAYTDGLGTWDLFAIRYAYAQVPPGDDEDVVLDRMVRDALDRGLIFLTDADARPAGAAHPLASLWDNGPDPVAELAEVLAVRRLALERFGAGNIAPGRPLALLEEVLAPVYLYHRFQLAAAAKSIGGLDYRHAVRGDGQPPARPVAGPVQRRALAAVLAAVDPAVLDIPDAVIGLLGVRPPEHGRNRELFGSRTSPAFDPLAAAATACDLAVREVLQPERLARMVDFHRRDHGLPDASEAIAAVVDAVFATSPETPRRAAIAQAEQRVVVDRLVGLAADEKASHAVRARAEAALAAVAERLAGGAAEHGHRAALRRDIVRFLEHREWRPSTTAPAPAAPPGEPIGGSGGWWGG